MILIFDLYGGFTDMLKDLVSINKFTNLHKIYFTIRYASVRSIDNPNTFNFYDVIELFDKSSFTQNEYYINYNSILNKINIENTYDFYSDKINEKLWCNNKKEYLNSIYSNIIQIFKNCNKDYIIIGGSFWWYSKLDNICERAKNLKIIKPSKKILMEYNNNLKTIPKYYNLIHYRYEEDWVPNLKTAGIPYIVPPLDELLKHLPFNKKYKVFICCSMIESLTEKKLLYNDLSSYKNIIIKKKNKLNYDENAFLDLLFGLKSVEVYGNSISGFSVFLNYVKNTNNYYNNMEIFNHYNIISSKLVELVDNSKTDKNTMHSYLELYDKLFVNKKQTVKNLLEISIGNVSSIKLWYEYFTNANVHALDIQKIENIWDELKDKKNITLYSGVDAYNETWFNNVFLNNNINFDLIIDDGPHTLETMKQFIKLYSQIISDDGILIIESIPSIDWIKILKNETPNHLKEFIQVYDLRLNKNRYDDILFMINKNEPII
jgi:hypothetical protein